jgi:hypothetical protein
MMMMGQSDLPCFVGGPQLLKDLRDRFFPTGQRMNELESLRFVDKLIAESLDNWRTRAYD